MTRPKLTAALLAGLVATITLCLPGTASAASRTGSGQPGVLAAACTYSVLGDWGIGFTAIIVITNPTPPTINGWTLTFFYPGNQRLDVGWNADWSQPPTGALITAINKPWNAIIDGTHPVEIGFNGTYLGGNPPPTGFTLNGQPC